MTFGRRGLEANRVPPNLRERPVATGSAGAGRRGLSPTQYWLGGLSVVALAQPTRPAMFATPTSIWVTSGTRSGPAPARPLMP
jgi:hypothetical protein